MKKLASIGPVILMMLLSFNSKGLLKESSYPFTVKTSGQGKQAIIFIPGFSCSGEVWNETKMKFEKDFTCYTLTMAGFAGVPAQAAASFKNWETAIAGFISEHKIEKPFIIGHSMGGGLAMALAADYPGLVGKIVVVDALPCLQAIMNPAFKTKENNDCGPVITRMSAMSDQQFLQMQKVSMGRLLADTSMQQTVIDWSVKSDRKTFAEMYCDFSNTDLREKVANIQCPNLVLLESYFANIKPRIETQFKAWKNANLQYAGKGLHFIMYDDKDWYFEQLKNFINN